MIAYDYSSKHRNSSGDFITVYHTTNDEANKDSSIKTKTKKTYFKG